MAFVQEKHQPRDVYLLENLFRCTYLALVKTTQNMSQGRIIRVAKFGLVQFLCEGNKKEFHECFLYRDLNGTWLSSTYDSQIIDTQ